MSHVLIHWEQENRFSVLQLSKVDLNGVDVDSPEGFIGLELPVKWDKTEPPENGRIINIGKKKALKREEMDLAQRAADESFELHNDEMNGVEYSGTGEAQSSCTVKSPIGISENQTTGDAHSYSEDSFRSDPLPNSSQNALDEISHLKDQLAKERSKNKRLERMLKKTTICSKTSDQTVDIGNNIELPKSFVDYLTLSFSARPSLFIRKMIFDSGLFKLEEIGNSSVSGKRSNSSPPAPRAALDPIKFATVKEFSMRTCGLKIGSVEHVRFELSLKDICTDARKRLKRQAAHAVPANTGEETQD